MGKNKFFKKYYEFLNINGCNDLGNIKHLNIYFADNVQTKLILVVKRKPSQWKKPLQLQQRRIKSGQESNVFIKPLESEVILVQGHDDQRGLEVAEKKEEGVTVWIVDPARILVTPGGNRHQWLSRLVSRFQCPERSP